MEGELVNITAWYSLIVAKESTLPEEDKIPGQF